MLTQKNGKACARLGPKGTGQGHLETPPHVLCCSCNLQAVTFPSRQMAGKPHPRSPGPGWLAAAAADCCVLGSKLGLQYSQMLLRDVAKSRLENLYTCAGAQARPRQAVAKLATPIHSRTRTPPHLATPPPPSSAAAAAAASPTAPLHTHPQPPHRTARPCAQHASHAQPAARAPAATRARAAASAAERAPHGGAAPLMAAHNAGSAHCCPAAPLHGCRCPAGHARPAPRAHPPPRHLHRPSC